MNPHPRKRCPTCRRPVAVTREGMFMTHRKPGTPWNCTGSGKRVELETGVKT